MVAKLLEYDRPLTLEDLDEIPEDGNRYEILQGELIVSPSPADRHQLILGRLHIWLAAAATSSRFGHVRLGPRDIRLSVNDIVEPDLFAYRSSQRGQSTERVFEGPPAFVVEIMSPSSRKYDQVRKASLYMRSGVDEYWVVDPSANRVMVHLATRAGTNPEIVFEGSLASAVIPGFTVDLAELFAPEEVFE